MTTSSTHQHDDHPKASHEEELPNNSKVDESHHYHEQILLSLPKGGNGWGIGDLYQYQGFWFPAEGVKSVMEFQQDFKALDTDLIITTAPKSGTVWLKSMAFAVVNRSRFPTSSSSSSSSSTKQLHPLLTTSPHDLVPFLEFKYFYKANPFPDFSKFQSPRLLATHVSYPSLPESIKNTNCKIVYLCRNPKDTFISHWHFWNQFNSSRKTNVDVVDSISIEEALDLYCNGVLPSGPSWDHLLGYWNESLGRPEKVLFLKYEDMKKDSRSLLKRLAEFLGYPFTVEEESEGVIEEILSLCSLDHLKNLDVNKNGKTGFNVQSKVFFRKGEVGDWKNYLTPLMAERIDRLFKEKLQGSGLVFQDYLN